MKTALLPAICFVSGLSAASSVLQEDLDPDANGSFRLLWETTPTVRYLLESSVDLEKWTSVKGFPSEAEARAQVYRFSMDPDLRARFFRVTPIDEQPPELIASSPADDAFGVARFRTLSFELSDRTGVDPGAIRLETETLGNFTVEDSELSWSDGVLRFDLGGDRAIGGYGETVSIRLSVADTLGNTTTHNLSFDLEIEPEISPAVFVFGSPQARRAGQQLDAPSAALAARFGFGTVRASGSATTWELDSVHDGFVVLSYDSGGAPIFEEGALLTNLTPRSPEEIFYRRVTGTLDDSANRLLILYTEDATLPEFMPRGSFDLSRNAYLLDFESQPGAVRAIELTESVEFEPIGRDNSGDVIFDRDGFKLTLEEAKAQLTPTISASLETSGLTVERFKISAVTIGELAFKPVLTFESEITYEEERKLWESSRTVWVVVGGVLPVAIVLDGSITLKPELSLGATGSASIGFRRHLEFGVSAGYTRVENGDPLLENDRWFDLEPLEIIPFTYSLTGSVDATLAIVPRLDVTLYGVAGVFVEADPRIELRGSASLTDGVLTSADWYQGFLADLTFGLVLSDIEGLPSYSANLFTFEESFKYPASDLSIDFQPASQTAMSGDDVTFTVSTTGGLNDLSYQWFSGDQQLAVDDPVLHLSDVTESDEGSYSVRVSDANTTLTSEPATLNIITAVNTGQSPTGFIRVPAGPFTMGHSASDPNPPGPYEDPYPVSLTRSFYIYETEMTWELWDDIRSWALVNGYPDLPEGRNGYVGNNDGTHPVTEVSWHDAVKWLNAWSEFEGLTPCYTVGGQVYRTGLAEPECNFNADGFRLPSEAEWEFACRAGTAGPFHGPNLSLIAWYRNNSGLNTHPVGEKTANAFGLKDMSGNVSEWVWDFHASYPVSATDPAGPATGSARVYRGGSFASAPEYCRSSHRYFSTPESRSFFAGFRPAQTDTP